MRILVSLLFIALYLPSGEAVQAADSGFTLDEFQAMEMRAPDDLDVILEAMYQTAIYAQAAIEHPTICFRPMPIPGAELRAMMAGELATPSDPVEHAYSGDDPAALVLVNALRAQNVCR